MATHQLAKGLASLGRHGDTMLMHVSPSEVNGLKALGAMTGRQVTTNPHTGMPEAFSFGDFFTSLIPTGIGFLLGGPAGAALGFEKGSMVAPVIGGMAAGAAVAGAKGEDPLMGGIMGGLGGYGGGNLAGTFGKMGANAANIANAANVATPAGGYTTPALEEALKKSVAGPMLPNAEAANTALLQQGTFNPALSQSIPGATVATMPTAGENIMSGVKQFASDPFGKGYKAFTDAGGTGMQLGMPLAMAGLAGAQEDLYPQPDLDLEARKKAEENKYRDPRTGLLNLSASPGLRLAASGGLMESYATGGTVGSNQSTISTGGIQDLYGTNDQTTGTQQLSKDGYGIGRLENLASQGSNAKAADTFYAAGGPVSFAEGGIAQGSAFYKLLEKIMPELFTKMRLNTAMANQTSLAPSEASTISPTNITGMYPQAKDNYMASAPTDKGTFALQAAKGGYLDGQGDGMSDSIPATIEGKRPARLADGEFVIPADVVSHIGNGSSKAGSQKLYSMLDRVRKARTGHTKQGKEINPNKYMPA